MSKINKIKLSGTTYELQDLSATSVVSLTQAEYDILPSSAKTANILYNITDAQGGDLSQYWTSAQTQSAITQATSGKADTSYVDQSVSGKVDNSVYTAYTASTDTELNNKVSTSAVTSAVTSGSTDVLTSGGAYNQFGGLKIQQITQSDYDALSPNYDASTLYVIVN